MRVTILALVTVISGCATFRGVSHSSESAWHKVTTAHFVLYTDLEERTAAEAAIELERTRDALISAAWPAFNFPDLVRTRVFVLANGLEFERVFGRQLAGLFRSGARPAFYLYGPPDRWSTRWSLQQRASFSILRHEMTHQLAAVVYSGAPRWFDEGLAQFLETVQLSEDRQSVVVGRTNVGALASFYATRSVTLKRTLEWNESVAELSDNERAGLYGMSWMFFHWLYNNRVEPFSRYQFALAEHVDPKKAWASTFAGLDLDSLDPILYEYARQGRAAIDTKPFQTSEPRIDVKPMSPADAHAARAQIALAGAHQLGNAGEALATEAKGEVAKALELDPTNVDALLLDDVRPLADRLNLVHQAAAAHPDDGRIFGLLGDLLSDPAERENAYRRAMALSPDDPGVLNPLAWLLLGRHRASEALPLALRALKRAPYDFNVIDTYAEALWQMGSCRGALEYEQRAVERAREASAASRRRLIGRLDKMRAACDEPDSQERIATTTAIPAPSDTVSNPTAPATPRRAPIHSGLYGAFGVGLGYGTGSYTRNSTYSSGTGSFEGGLMDLNFAAGYGVLPGLAVALEGGLVGQPDVQARGESKPEDLTSGLVFMRVGVLVDGYPNSSFHLMGGIDWIRGTWSGLAWLPDETPTGWVVHASAGPAWRFHGYDLGPALRIYRASLTSDHTEGDVFGFEGVVSAVWF